jgi:hypothetical protein
MGSAKFKTGDNVTLNEKAPKVHYNRYKNKVGKIKGSYYGEYDVEYVIGDQAVRCRFQTAFLDKWTGGSKREIFIKELKKIEIIEGELQRKRTALQDRLDYMGEVGVEKFKESEYRAHKIIKISKDPDL